MLKSVKHKSVGFKNDELLIPEEAAKKQNMTKEEWHRWATEEVVKGALRPVYRLKTDKLAWNPWSVELHQFATIFTFEDGSEIDGQDPKNVEIAFLKR